MSNYNINPSALSIPLIQEFPLSIWLNNHLPKSLVAPGLYAVFNDLGECVYIGMSAVNIRTRLHQHFAPRAWKTYSRSSLGEFIKQNLNKCRNWKLVVALLPLPANDLRVIETEFLEELRPPFNNFHSRGYKALNIKSTPNKPVVSVGTLSTLSKGDPHDYSCASL